MFAVNAELPGHIRRALPEAAQTRFRMTANSVLEKAGNAKSAINMGWLAVKRDWERGADKWVRKVAAPVKEDDLQKAKPRTLYVCRTVQNAAEIIKWAKDQGFKTTLEPGDLHVTVVYSRAPIDWMKITNGWTGDEKGNLTVKPGGPRLVEPLGDKGAVVLLFSCDELKWRHDDIIRQGASHDFEGYQPHITITWDAEGLDVSKVEPYAGKIVLGPEEFKEVNDHWADNITEKCLYAGINAGLISKAAGWGSVRDHGGGNPYHDTNNGQFTSGPSAGGSKHFAAHVAGKVAATLAVDHVIGDWFSSSHAKRGGDAEKSAAVHEKLQEPKTQHSVAATVAKEVVHALIVVGVELATATAIGKAAKLMMPFLSGPAKSLATSAAAVVLKQVATRIPAATMLSVLKRAVGKSLARGVGFAKAEVTSTDLVTFQLERLRAVLDDIEAADLTHDRATEFLKAKYPEVLKNILADLEDAGFTDLDQTVADHAMDARVVKVDTSLGLVFGWAIVCKKDGQDYYDLNRDSNGERVPEHIPEQAMLEATADFMENSRVHKEMHEGDQRGSVVFAFPLTTDIAKAMGIETKTTGLLVAMKPDKAMLAKYASGELTGFSIGGSRTKSRETVDT